MDKTVELNWMINYLEAEQEVITDSEQSPFQRWRHLVNLRPAKAVSDEYLAHEDAFLKDYNSKEAITYLSDLEPIIGESVYLWQGDITQLAVDGIVNAANSELLGCFIPNHNCIDNIIHTKAGVRLRLDCHEIMVDQGRKEAVGKAKITPAYQLPSKYIIHTVGPTAQGRVTALNQKLLAKSYQSCLKLADEHHLESLAFCCISTGVFGFPQEAAAEIAINTVREYLAQTNSPLKVIFNVFGDDDLAIYQSKLKRGEA